MLPISPVQRPTSANEDRTIRPCSPRQVATKAPRSICASPQLCRYEPGGTPCACACGMQDSPASNAPANMAAIVFMTVLPFGSDARITAIAAVLLPKIGGLPQMDGCRGAAYLERAASR